jgi:hypothetical protein
MTVRPESIGGTPANRMIHRESSQLFIGPYAIDAQGRVRTIPYERMYGRPTGTARHLTEPANKVYFASMEEGFYEVDVQTLEVKQLYEDGNSMVRRKAAGDIAGPLLPGYHGKGLYSGQGRLIYSNNGEYRGETMPPNTPSGCLAEWDGKQWTVVRRNQFTEVTGPGGLYGNAAPETDPVWSVGWDHCSVILMLLDRGRWHTYRLPKASHTYDGAHGWNTEWPRIRDIGEKDLLMTMHGMFWRFPTAFSRTNSAGIAPRSTYLRVIGDFARWGDRVVFGCDDTAKSEFTNKRRAKGALAGPGQSQSNLWFVDPGKLDRLGAPIGRGAVWIENDLTGGDISDPFLFSGFDRRLVQVTHEENREAVFTFEVDRKGDDRWEPLRKIKVPANGYAWTTFEPAEKGCWVRARAEAAVRKATVFFQYANNERRSTNPGLEFEGLARPTDTNLSGGLLWARGDNKRTLLFAARNGLYELDADLKLRLLNDKATLEWIHQHAAIPRDILKMDAASVIYTDEAGKRWRLPKGDPAFDMPGPLGDSRVAREVSTERDLLNAHGTFYELPAENAGGIAMVRPIATHNRRIYDYCSYRGLVVISGVSAAAPSSKHIVRSQDGKAALWLGVSDDLWNFGKARGRGGPWHNTAVREGERSEPYLMTGYDKKGITLSHSGKGTVTMTVEVDLTGTGLWRKYRSFDVGAGDAVEHTFPAEYQAYWVRIVADKDCMATATFDYS